MSRSVRDVRGAVVGVSIFTVIAVACTWLIWSTLNNYLSGDTEQFTAQFTDASGLHVGDDVRIAGVRAGRVDELELNGRLAEVTFSVQTSQQVFANTRAQLRYQNLTGQRYLALRPGPGRAKPLPAGSTIPVDRTDPSLDLSALLGGLEPLFAVLEPADLNRLADNITGVLHGEGPALAGLLSEAAQLLAEFDDRDELLVTVITNLNGVLEHLDGATPQFERLIGQTRTLVDGLDRESGSIFKAVEKIGRVSSSVTSLIGEVRPELRADLAKFNQVAALYLGEEDAVEQTIDTLPKFLEGVTRITQHGSWMQLYACRINLDLPGLPPGLVGDLIGTKQSEVCR